MLRMRPKSTVLAGFVFLLAAGLGHAADQSTASMSRSGEAIVSATREEELAARFTGLAGSEANAKALVSGLRNGTSITLTSTSSGGTGGTSTTFTPATGKMGFGNVTIALSLTKAELASQGITSATPQQLEAALNGGSITTSKGTATLSGILQLRAEGKGWGGIADSLGFKLGEVVSASRTPKDGTAMQARGRTEKVERTAKEGRADTFRSDRALRPERVERPEKPERPERAERPERPERPEHAQRAR